MKVIIENIGVVIATRDLKLGDNTVTVILGRPEKFPEGVDYYCPFQIQGMGSDKIRYAGGVDAIQALMLCLKMIGAVLYTTKAVKEGKLTWEAGSDVGDLGFLKP